MRNGGDQRIGVELAHADNMIALRHREQRPYQATDMEQRNADQVDAVRSCSKSFRGRMDEGEDVAIGEHRAFRSAGGAGGIEQQRDLVGTGSMAGIRCILSRQPSLEGLVVRMAAEENYLADCGCIGGDCRQLVGKILMDKQDLRFRIVDDVRHFRRRQTPVDGDFDRTELACTDQDLKGAMIVLVDDRDSFTEANTFRSKTIRDSVGSIANLSVAERTPIEGRGWRIGLRI